MSKFPPSQHKEWKILLNYIFLSFLSFLSWFLSPIFLPKTFVLDSSTVGRQTGATKRKFSFLFILVWYDTSLTERHKIAPVTPIPKEFRL